MSLFFFPIRKDLLSAFFMKIKLPHSPLMHGTTYYRSTTYAFRILMK